MMSATNLEITSALKTALKSRGMTYRKVADEIGVSEKTIKRIFIDKNCSLNRLTQICEVINLSLYDLLDFAQHYSKPPIRLNETQEQFLGENPQHFSFLFFLTVGYSATQIQTQYQLSELSVFRYLRDLDKYHFLELAEHNRYRLLVDGKLLVPLHGPLHDFVRTSNQHFIEYVINNDGHKNVDFRGSFQHMSQETLTDLNKELTALSDKYQKLAQRDEAILPRKKLLPVKWCFSTGPFDVFGKWEINEL